MTEKVLETWPVAPGVTTPIRTAVGPQGDSKAGGQVKPSDYANVPGLNKDRT